MITPMITLTTDTSKSLVLGLISPLYFSCRSRNSKNSEEDPTSQESEATPPPAQMEGDLREKGNALFRKGKYQEAIQMYEEAVKSGRCSQEDKAKCWR